MNKPYLIAELGLLHYKNTDVVRDTARKVKKAGFDALKIQHFTTPEIYDKISTTKGAKEVQDKYARRELMLHHLQLFRAVVRDENLDFGITAHNLTAAYDLMMLDVNFYTQDAHHGPSAMTSREDCVAHRVPDSHERYWTRGIRL